MIEDAPPIMPGTSPVSLREGLRSKRIFVTGSTGFLAKAFIERVLRSIPAARVVLLIRSRRKRDGTLLNAEERFRHDVLFSTVFDRLRREWGAEFERRVYERIRVVEGDVGKERLGIGSPSYQTLSKEIDLIVNAAATVSFDERLDEAIRINAQGPAYVLQLAEDAGVPLLHISTAYVSGQRTGCVREQPLETDRSMQSVMTGGSTFFSAEQEIAVARDTVRRVQVTPGAPARSWAFFADTRNSIRKARLNGSLKQPDAPTLHSKAHRELVRAGMDRARQHGWHDTYTYTKALGEIAISCRMPAVPVRIIRPSIIESALSQPEPGWIEGYRMADPLITAVGKGKLWDFPANPDTVLDLVPVDCVVNVMLAVAALDCSEAGVRVYQVATGAVNPVKIGQVNAAVREHFLANPVAFRKGKAVRLPHWKYSSLEKFEKAVRWRRWLLHTAASLASLVPVLQQWSRRMHTMRRGIDRALYLAHLYHPYMHSDYRFCVERSRELMRKLMPAEQQEFSYAPEAIDWPRYLIDIHIPGLRKFVWPQHHSAPSRATMPIAHEVTPILKQVRDTSGNDTGACAEIRDEHGAVCADRRMDGGHLSSRHIDHSRGSDLRASGNERGPASDDASGFRLQPRGPVG